MPNRMISRAGVSPDRSAMRRAHWVKSMPPAAAALTRLAGAAGTSAAMATTGATGSPLVPIGVAVAAACGLHAGLVAGAIAGVVVVAGSVPVLAGEAGAGLAAVNHVAAWAILFPLAGTTAGLVRMLRARPDAGSERKRIARDLHDGVAQTLAHLRFELDMLAHPGLAAATDPEGLARLARVADRTLSDVRALIQDLSAPLPPGGLPQALAEHVHDLQTGHGPLVVFEIDEPPALPSPVESQLLRIAQEAISNAVRHSGASIVRVALTGDRRGGVVLFIDDNGRGIGENAGRGGGLGLGTMRERARAVGAELTIRTGAEGTRVTAERAASLTRSA